MNYPSDTDIFNSQLAEQLAAIANLTSKNPEMHRCLQLAHAAGRSSTPVTITGESGCGKSLLAQYIHYISPRRAKACVVLNCATSMAADLMAEIFGDARTQSLKHKEQGGLIGKADGGTLILDSADMLSVSIQRELLSVLKEKRYRNVGSGEGLPLRTHFIATSLGEPEKKENNGFFVEELAYMLGEVVVRVPPLRHRQEDLPDLVKAALQSANQLYGKNIKGISHSATELIRHYDFPGNIRELFLIMNRAVKSISRDVVYAEDLELAKGAVDAIQDVAGHRPLPTLADMEKGYINKALLRTGWKKRATARILGITETALERKIATYGLDRRARPR